MLEIKPLFNNENCRTLLKEIKNLKNYSITSFKEKNITNLYKMKKNLNLGLLIPSTFTFNKILKKSKKKHVKFLVLEKKFLSNKNLHLIRKKIYYYTIKNKNLFKKYRYTKNLIFEKI